MQQTKTLCATLFYDKNGKLINKIEVWHNNIFVITENDFFADIVNKSNKSGNKNFGLYFFSGIRNILFYFLPISSTNTVVIEFNDHISCSFYCTHGIHVCSRQPAHQLTSHCLPSQIAMFVLLLQ